MVGTRSQERRRKPPPVEDPPVEESPVEESPLEESPVEDSPDEDSPVEESADEEDRDFRPGVRGGWMEEDSQEEPPVPLAMAVDDGGGAWHVQGLAEQFSTHVLEPPHPAEENSEEEVPDPDAREEDDEEAQREDEEEGLAAQRELAAAWASQDDVEEAWQAEFARGHEEEGGPAPEPPPEGVRPKLSLVLFRQLVEEVGRAAVPGMLDKYNEPGDAPSGKLGKAPPATTAHVSKRAGLDPVKWREVLSLVATLVQTEVRGLRAWKDMDNAKKDELRREVWAIAPGLSKKKVNKQFSQCQRSRVCRCRQAAAFVVMNKRQPEQFTPGDKRKKAKMPANINKDVWTRCVREAELRYDRIEKGEENPQSPTRKVLLLLVRVRVERKVLIPMGGKAEMGTLRNFESCGDGIQPGENKSGQLIMAWRTCATTGQRFSWTLFLEKTVGNKVRTHLRWMAAALGWVRE